MRGMLSLDIRSTDGTRVRWARQQRSAPLKLEIMFAVALAVSAPGAWAFDPVHEVTWGERIEVASGDAYQKTKGSGLVFNSFFWS